MIIIGRVHDATVSGIDSGKDLVSVEWFERGETKGKEVSQPGMLVTTVTGLFTTWWSIHTHSLSLVSSLD